MNGLLPYAANEINHFIDKLLDLVDLSKGQWDKLRDWFEVLLIRLKLGDTAIRYSDQILIALVVFVLLVVLVVFLLIRRRKPSKKRLPSGPVSPKEAKKAAKLAAKQGNLVRAGEFYEQAGDYSKAIKAYTQGRAMTRAAQVYAKKLQNPKKGIELLLENRLFEPAASLYASMDNYGDAARLYMQAGKEQMAAEAFDRAGSYREAAQLYKKFGRLPEAGRCFAQAQVWSEAGEVYTQMYKDYKKAVQGRAVDKDLAKLQDLAKKAAYYLKQDGQFKRSGEILSDARLGQFAAEMFALAGETERAAELYVEHKEFKKAAELFAKSGNKQRAAEIMAAWHQSEGRGGEAAKFLEMSGDYLAAADLAAGKGDYIRAAKLYMKGGDSRTASEMFMAAGRPNDAVKIFEQQGDLEAAIRMCEETGNTAVLAGLYERTKRFFKAAQIYQEQGEADKAMAMLGKVPPDHPNFAEAQYRLGEIYLQKGDAKTALDRLQAMAGRVALGPQTMDQYYMLGMAYEKAEHPMYALGVFQQLAAMNYNFRDVVMRVNVLTQKIQTQQGAHGKPGARPGGTMAQRYKVVNKLGEGGMGVVYLAEDLHLGRKVAFKVLPEEFKSNTMMVANFIREARSLAQLSHPYIVSVFDAGEEGGMYFIIMEYVEGKDFKELLGENKRLPIAAGVQVFSQIAQAMDYAHGLKIIHRDIKPANIMWIASTKIIKVMDFGLAKVMDQMREGRTQVAGTPYYMSPEQTLGINVDHRTDIYAVGVTMYELLTGKVPFSEGDIGYQHIHTPPQPPSQLNPQIPPELERIILKCMAKDAKLRYQSAGQINEELIRLGIQKGA